MRDRVVRLALLGCIASGIATFAPPPARAQCGPDGAPPCMPPEFGLTDCCREIEYVNSYDPNDKVGLPGYGAQRSIAAGAFLPYVIYFENLPAATAPAQEVRVTDNLDPARFDLATFTFTGFGFGDTSLVVPPGSSSHVVNVDLRPGQNLIVRFEGALDPQTGGLTCRFRSIDPATGDPLDDPDGGFLPPNQNPPAGEGHVSFVVRAKPALPTGTRIANTAHIVFDVNPPIDTPEWFNTVDADLPVSEVDALPPIAPRRDFGVSWSGGDVGSGLRDYTVFVSDDGAPYAPWRVATTAQTDTFPGEHGHTYRFYTVCRDSAGNVEPAPGQPDATVYLDTTTAALPSLVDARSDGRHVRLLWFAAETPAGLAVERRTKATEWAVVGAPVGVGRSYLEFRDSTVVAGERYGYRLSIPGGGGAASFGEVWVHVYATLEFAFAPIQPNPARNPIVVDYAVPGAGNAFLEMFDARGRRVLARRLSDLGPGSHRYSLAEAGPLAAGGYMIRLSHGGRALTRKVVVMP